MHADSSSDSASESRNKYEEIILINCLDSNCASTSRSLPPLYAPALLNKGHSLRQLPESESEPESACTMRVAPTGADSRNRIRNLNLPALYAYPYTAVLKEGICSVIMG